MKVADWKYWKSKITMFISKNKSNIILKQIETSIRILYKLFKLLENIFYRKILNKPKIKFVKVDLKWMKKEDKAIKYLESYKSNF